MSDILVVEDMDNPRQVLTILLRKEGYNVEEARNGMEALGKMREKAYDLIVTDLKMEPIDGLEILRKTKKFCPSTEVILLTAFGTIENSVDAMKLGAYDYFKKPYHVEELLSAIRRALNKSKYYEEKVDRETRNKFPDIIYQSEIMNGVLTLIDKISNTDSTVLISGESGTGKELIARAIHSTSRRQQGSIVSINCGALPDTLLETELFGHIKGSFTGAVKERKGLFSEAHGGTILLDEIGDISPQMQVKLLRVLQEGEIRPVGSDKQIQVDVRVIAASNKSLAHQVESGLFREDLFYRLNVIPIQIPSLRERSEDVPLLARHFVDAHARQMNKNVPEISDAAMDILIKYRWPGNVRELENLVERTIALTDHTVIRPEDLSPSFPKKVLIDDINFEECTLEEMEKYLIMKHLTKYGNNPKLIAKKLGISPTTLWRKIKSYDLSTDQPAQTIEEEGGK
ncbi:MAG: sigma-54 dependent transcriptional regulator [candidate division KSB1 bacterium]|nr:sigma-54 dependent transcriptional regulator [candidate division KSB1 bacterium]